MSKDSENQWILKRRKNRIKTGLTNRNHPFIFLYCLFPQKSITVILGTEDTTFIPEMSLERLPCFTDLIFILWLFSYFFVVFF